MAVIKGIRDTLDEQVCRFEQAPLRQPVLLNSIPKGGTHLLRNILRMFVPVEQHHDRDFVQAPNMHEHLDAFNPHAPKLAERRLREARHLVVQRILDALDDGHADSLCARDTRSCSR